MTPRIICIICVLFRLTWKWSMLMLLILNYTLSSELFKWNFFHSNLWWVLSWQSGPFICWWAFSGRRWCLTIWLLISLWSSNLKDTLLSTFRLELLRCPISWLIKLWDQLNLLVICERKWHSRDPWCMIRHSKCSRSWNYLLFFIYWVETFHKLHLCLFWCLWK